MQASSSRGRDISSKSYCKIAKIENFEGAGYLPTFCSFINQI